MLALDYLRRSRRTTPEIEVKALEYINVGYQRLLTFEVAGGGFDWYGKAPANTILSAYAVLEFSDMAKVYEIDTRVIDRTRTWLLSQQKADGSWAMPPRTAWSWTGLSGDFVVTSYVAWTLAESGFRGKPLDLATQWIRDHLDEAKDAYSRGLAMNALVAADPKGHETSILLQDLESRKVDDAESKTTRWNQDGKTAFYAQGDYANVETTALVVNGLLRSGSYANTINRALAYLARMKHANGTWGTTSATILSLRAILQGMSGGEMTAPATVRFTLNGASREARITPDQSDVLQIVAFRDGERELAIPGANDVGIETEGETNSMVQVVARSWIPWKDVPREARKPLDIAVTYDRTKLSKADVLRARVKMTYNGVEPTFMVCMDLGIPPAFVVDDGAFEKMVKEKRLDKFGMTARQITLYFGRIEPGQVVEFAYELRAKYPVKVKTPKSTAYEYYAPDRRAEAEPVELEVGE
ncbi:MAG: hypothetical protein HYY18_11415 [Planctomycetes bacterium]|nr:hypothetical protein [Planctomycetota bacterium]